MSTNFLLALLPQVNFRFEFSLKLKGLNLGFPTGRDSATFWDKGMEFPLLSRDKGATEQAQNFAMGQDRPGQDTGQDNLYFSVKIRERPFPVFCCFLESDFVPGQKSSSRNFFAAALVLGQRDNRTSCPMETLT